MADEQRPVPVTLEIASIKRDLFRPPVGGRIARSDETLATRGGGRDLWIYDDLELDPTVYAEMQKRKSAVVSYAWQVEAASTSRLDKRAADIVRAQLDKISFDEASKQLLDAILKGFAVVEVMWDNSGSETVVKALLPRDARRFAFDEDGKLRLLTAAQPWRGEEVPERKFITHSVGAKDGSPWGLGLGTRLFWPVLFKRQDMEFWLTFADKFGSPTTRVTYPQGSTPDEIEKVVQVLERLAQNATIAIPEGMVVELLEASRTTANDFYELLQPVLDAILNADDYQAAFAALDRAVPGMHADQLERALGQAMFVAETWGRLNGNDA